MIGTRNLAPAAAVWLLLTAVGALAQPAGDTQAAPPDQAPATENDNSAGTASGATPTPAPTPAGRAPSDYRASEEISEDLPVSFPVDI